MATNSNYASGGNTDRKKTGKKKKNQVKIIIFIIEIIIILAMLLVVWKVFQTTENSEGPKFVEVETSDVSVNQEVINRIESAEQNVDNTGEAVVPVPAITQYETIALFGLDAINSSQLEKSSRSDSIMIASINKETGDIKLVSVYRDTYLNISNDKYTKCNAAYSKGGAKWSLSMLNMNMDLAITNFVAVGYRALIDTIDALGGIYIEIDSEELKHINNYQKSIVKDLSDVKEKEYIAVTDTGYQKVTGLQAAAYCRIRQTAGDDFKRAERQREVIKAMADRAYSADLDTLTDIVDKVTPNIYTSLDKTEILSLLADINKYEIVEEGGFPTEDNRTTANVGGEGSCVIPLDLEENVVWLHEFLYGDVDYEVSSSVKEYGAKIKSDTQPYINKISE